MDGQGAAQVSGDRAWEGRKEHAQRSHGSGEKTGGVIRTFSDMSRPPYDARISLQ